MYTFRLALYRGNTLIDFRYVRASCRPDAIAMGIEWWADVRGIDVRKCRITAKLL